MEEKMEEIRRLNRNELDEMGKNLDIQYDDMVSDESEEKEHEGLEELLAEIQGHLEDIKIKSPLDIKEKFELAKLMMEAIRAVFDNGYSAMIAYNLMDLFRKMLKL